MLKAVIYHPRDCIIMPVCHNGYDFIDPIIQTSKEYFLLGPANQKALITTKSCNIENGLVRKPSTFVDGNTLSNSDLFISNADIRITLISGCNSLILRVSWNPVNFGILTSDTTISKVSPPFSKCCNAFIGSAKPTMLKPLFSSPFPTIVRISVS